MSITQDELEIAVLHALYRFAQEREGRLTARAIIRLLPNPVSSARVEMALGVLEKQDFVYGSHSYMSDDESEFQITDQGYKAAEQRDRDASTADDVALDTAPAADRIVGFDHNQRDYKAVRSGVTNLAVQLRDANDLGDLTPRAAAVAATEVDDLGSTLDHDFFRPHELWRRARSSLTWIGKEAAGAAVGAAALALLALFASLLGFPIG